MKKAKVITVINYKGGVGKTVSTYNLGAGISFLANKSVLLVDLDPQCSLTNICLKAHSNYELAKGKSSMAMEDLKLEQTINYVIKKYLEQSITGDSPKFDLDMLVLKDFYKGRELTLPGLGAICATMFDDSDSEYNKGLDDLEIDIASYQFGDKTRLQQLSIFPKFFTDTGLDDKYDFIVFDCPPANNLITQNALMVSDYYLIPTIMDDMSSTGIIHFNSLIQNTIFNGFKKQYGAFIENTNVPYFEYFKKETAKLLGVFETLRKTQSDTSDYRRLLKNIEELQGKLFDETIFHHKGTAEATGRGISVFSTDLEKGEYSPHLSYGHLIISMLDRMEIAYDKNLANKRVTSWL
ncbi:ParA family protein [Paenibacillus planticolens]|uniref:AAA family ATPase n=1 Tax=Paenibacillus planticolens TaxID=2654976 RepID=A0ABX1ZID3_9BACL|nr:ParA family protein [Paenibacillus planticolens]NOU99795.1 AAA family ATPase [Paenibacillus planticolens]